MPNSKIILLINIPGGIIGGAQKRYLALFDHISKERNDYYLVVNQKLYNTMLAQKCLSNFENVIAIRLYGEKKLSKKQINKSKIENKPISNSFRKKMPFLGKSKMFVKSILRWITFVIQFSKVIKKLHCRQVYAIWTGGIYAWPLKKILKFKLIYSYNDASVAIISKSLSQLFDYSEYWVLKHADQIDFLSEAIVDLYKKKIGTISKNRILITPNSFINYSRFYRAAMKEKSVVFLSRLWNVKNPMLLLAAINLLNKRSDKYTEIKYYLIGQGDLAQQVRAYINDNNLTNVDFVGVCYEPWKYLQKSRAFVSIQQGNNYPSQSLLEAMACENAIIASDVGETRKLVTEDEGILVSLNAEEIAGAIEKLFIDDKLTEQLGKNARNKVIENHTIEKYTEYFYNINDLV